MFYKRTVTEVSHAILQQYIGLGDTVVDGTVGTGQDTVFLRQLVGPKGTVYGFDIQQEALDMAWKLLEGMAIDISRVRLFLDSHNHVDQYVKGEINGAVFNLGYLPTEKSDHSIITHPETTIPAIEKIMDKLSVGGVIVVVCYYGHEGGTEEKEALEQFLEGVGKEFLVSKVSMVNRKKNPPIIFFIEK